MNAFASLGAVSLFGATAQLPSEMVAAGEGGAASIGHRACGTPAQCRDPVLGRDYTGIVCWGRNSCSLTKHAPTAAFKISLLDLKFKAGMSLERFHSEGQHRRFSLRHNSSSSSSRSLLSEQHANPPHPVPRRPHCPTGVIDILIRPCAGRIGDSSSTQHNSSGTHHLPPHQKAWGACPAPPGPDHIQCRTCQWGEFAAAVQMQ